MNIEKFSRSNQGTKKNMITHVVYTHELYKILIFDPF